MIVAIRTSVLRPTSGSRSRECSVERASQSKPEVVTPRRRGLHEGMLTLQSTTIDLETQPREREALMPERPDARVASIAQLRSLDLGTGVMPRTDRKRTLIDREPLERGLLEGGRKLSYGRAVVELVEVALSLRDFTGDVEAS
jgi:hypothetical protein